VRPGRLPWVKTDVVNGRREAWQVRGEEEIAPGIVLVSLPPHRGHACVAVDAGHRWCISLLPLRLAGRQPSAHPSGGDRCA
jgi:hypothetical protein